MSDTESENDAAHGFVVDEAESGQRLDRFLATRPSLVAASLSRTRLKALIEGGRVRVGGRVLTDASAKLAAGDTIAIDIPPPVAPHPKAEDIPLDVVFEDDHIVVIDKPAGLVVHPAAGNETGTLVNALIAHCGDSLSGVGGVKRPGIVHRLDKDTSGLLVVAKTDAAHRALSALFADHGRTMGLVRDYRAFVWGAPTRKAGTIDAPLGRHPIHREKMAVVDLEKGRHAVTHWRVADSFGAATEILCRLETGRTHQIRVHLAHLGHPLLGDPTYGAGWRTKASLLPPAALERQALHASTLGFPHPVTGEELRFESSLPPDMAALRDALAERG